MNLRLLALFGLCLVLLNFATLDVYVNHVVTPGSELLVHGTTTENTSTIGASVVGEGISATNTTDASGNFDIHLTAPTDEDSYALEVNNTEGDEKTLPILVSNISSATITVVGTPTYAVGETFQVNITSLNSSSAALQNHAPPTVSIFRPMSGVDDSWTITNTSATTGTNGAVVYNITIASMASGPYALVVEDAASSDPFVFDVKAGDSGVEFSVSPQTEDGVDSPAFGTGSTVTVKATLKYGDGTMISGATVHAYVVAPDGTASLLTLSETALSGVYSTTYDGTDQSGSYVINAKAEYNDAVFRRTTAFDVGSIFVDLMPKDDKFFKEGEDGGKMVIMPGSEAAFVVMVRNLTTGEFVEGSSDGSTPGTVNCSAISLEAVTRMNDSTEVSVSNFGSSTTTYFGGTSCYVNFTAPSSSAIYRLDVNVLWNGENTTGTTFLPVQTFLLRVQPVTEVVEGEQSFKQMFAPGSNATFKLVAINSSDDALDGSTVSDIAVQALFNLPTGQDIEVSSLNEAADNSEDTIQITLPDSPTDAYILTVSATVNDGVTSETVTGDVFFFSKYIVGFLQPASSGGGGEGFTGDEGKGGASGCSGTEPFIGSVMLADTGEAVDNVFLNAAPQLMMEESTGKMMTDCISFAENVSSDGQLYTSVTFDDDCDFSGFYFFMTNVTYSDDNGAHTDSLPGFFQCVEMSGDVAFDPEGEGWSISSTGKINVTASEIAYLNGTALGSGTIEVVELRVYDMGPPKFLSPATDLVFDIEDGNASFQLSPQNFSNGAANLTRWAGSSGQIEGELEVCDDSDVCSTFETGIPIESATDVWVWARGGSASFVVGQNVTLDVYAKTNLSAGGFAAKFEKEGVPGGIASPGVYASLVSDGWNAPGDAGQEHWEVNVTTPSGVQKGTVRLAFIMVDGVTGEEVRRSVYGSVQSATLGVAQAGIPFYENGSVMGSIDAPGYNASLAAEGWNITWLQTNFSITDTAPYSQLAFMPNFTVVSWVMAGEEYSTINESKKLLCMDADDDGVSDTIFIRDTTYVNSTYNSSAYTQINSSNRDMGDGIYLWALYGCGYIKVVDASADPSSWVGEFGVNQNALIPYIVKQGSNPVVGVTVNVSSMYFERDEGYGLGTQLTSDKYTITPAVTDSNGVAWVTLNVTSSGRYKLFWKINGTVNDSAIIESASQFEARYISARGLLLYDWGNGIAAAYMTNATAGAGSLMCPAGGCSDVFNGSISDFYGLGTLYVAVNGTSSKLSASLLGLNSTCPQTGGTCYTNSSEIEFINGSGHINGYDLLGFGVAGSATGGDTKNYSFYLWEPSYGNQQTVSATQTVSIRVCAEEVTPSTSNEAVPITNGNITALYVKEYPFNSPPVTTVLNMFDPVTGTATSVIPLQPDGCAAFRTNRSSGSWSTMTDLRANITAIVDGSSVTESAYVGHLNR